MVVLVVTIFEIHGDPQPFHPNKRDVLVAMVTVFEVHEDRTIPRRPFVTRLRQGPAGNLNLSFTKMLRWQEIITVVF